MDYLGGPHGITRVLLRGRQEGQTLSRCENGSRGPKDRDWKVQPCWLGRQKKGPRAKEFGCLLEAGKGVIKDSPLEPPEVRTEPGGPILAFPPPQL